MKKIMILVCLLSASWASAEIIEVSPTFRGKVGNYVFLGSIGHYAVGGRNHSDFDVTVLVESRNYFEFDLSGFTNAITATLRINTFDVSASGTYTLYDALPRSIFDPRPSWEDLGGGVSYGSTFISDTQDNQYIEIVLNAAAISSINAAGGSWIIGGSYSANADGQHAFGGSTADAGNMLIIDASPIPEPGVIGLMGIFGGGLLFLRRYFPQV